MQRRIPQVGRSACAEGEATYIPVKILITRGLDVYPELAPTVGRVYDAERHEGQRAPGYVITSGGKRINVRADECREI